MKVRAYIRNPKYGEAGQPEFLEVPFRGEDKYASLDARLTAVETNKANVSDVVTDTELTQKNYVNLDYLTTELAKKQDTGSYATTDDISGFMDQTAADARYQFKGSYITQTDANNLYQQRGDYLDRATADTLYQPIGGSTEDYLTQEDADLRYAKIEDVPDISNKADKVSVVDGGTGSVTLAIQSNTFYTFTTPTALNLTLVTPSDNSVLNIYAFQFTTGSSVPSLNISGVTAWAGGSNPYLEANKTYQVTILNGLAAIGGG